MAAEVDKLLQERATQESHRNMAAEIDRRMTAQSVATPAQQIIREHHTINQPIYIPTPAVPSVSTEVRHTGHSVHEIFIRQDPILQRRPQGEIPITYFNNNNNPPPPPGGAGGQIVRGYGPASTPKPRPVPFQMKKPDENPIISFTGGSLPPPPPPPPGRELVRSYGPSKLSKNRMNPFQGQTPMNPGGGATSPMPIPQFDPPKRKKYSHLRQSSHPSHQSESENQNEKLNQMNQIPIEEK